jgi:rare lipoprotein A
LRQNNIRVRRAVLASGAITVTSALAATPMLAQADSVATATPAASTTLTARAASTLSVDRVRRNVVAGGTVVVKGSLRPLTGERPIRLQIQRRHGWRTVDRDTTTAAGSYLLKWRARGSVSVKARLIYAGNDEQMPVRRRIGFLNVYRSAFASYYGPGLYGNHLGCGGRLMPGTIGVAHKHLRCGSRVTLRYRGRVVHARVIDRGPYVSGREFDLTAATKTRLGFGSTGRIQVATG